MGRHKTYDRDEVLDRAMKLFWRKGYEGAHLQELVEVTGLNRFSLYKEFGGKEGLFLEAFERYLCRMNILVQELKAEPAGLDNIRNYFLGVLEFPAYHGCFAINTLVQHPVIPDEARKKVFKFIMDGEKLFLKNLRAAYKEGKMDADLDPVSMARFLLVFDLGLFTSTVLGPHKKETRRALKPLEKLFGSVWND